MEKNQILAKQVILSINIKLLFEYKACCFLFMKRSWWERSSHHPCLTVFFSSFRSQIKYHPEKLKPFLTFYVLSEYSAFFLCCISCHDYFNNRKLMTPSHWNVSPKRTQGSSVLSFLLSRPWKPTRCLIHIYWKNKWMKYLLNTFLFEHWLFCKVKWLLCKPNY